MCLCWNKDSKLIIANYTDMSIPTPVTLASATEKHSSRASQAIRWFIPPVGGFVLSLAFPNEVIPGRWGDHPPALLAWLAIIPLLWIVQTYTARAARVAGYVYACVFFAAALSWMRLFGVLPWLMLAGALALFAWLAVWMAQRLALPPWLFPLGFALCWTGLEWLRSQSIFGFSWAEIGASQVDGVTAAMASLGSVYLISFIMLWSVGTLLRWRQVRQAPRWYLPVLAGVVALCLAGGWWQTRLTTARWLASPRTQTFALVQPSLQRGLTPEALVNAPSVEELLRREAVMCALSRQSVAQCPPVEHPLIIWAESAVGYPPYTTGIISMGRETRSHLLIGAVSFPPPVFAPRNSAYLVGPSGTDEGRYDKIHLVPFGEFVPLRKLVTRFYTVRDNDLTRGDGWKVMEVERHRFGLAICFESIFPSIARAYARQGAHYLIYITNDAWFHRTSAVRQHFNHARFRALETGLPVIRTASTGISGFIAPNGRIISEIPTYAAGTRTRRIAEGTAGTVYTRVGWLFAPCCCFAALALLMLGLVISWRQRNQT